MSKSYLKKCSVSSKPNVLCGKLSSKINPLFKCKQVFFVLCLLLLSLTVMCQKDIDYKFGNVTTKDFDVSSSKIIDSGAAAIILYEAGSTHFIGNNSNWFDYVYTCTRRIKINSQKAFDLATVKLPLFVYNAKDPNDLDNNETVSNVKAVTYNLDNGKVSALQLDTKDVFTDKEDEDLVIKKFTLPAIKEGCIIEYTFTITSPDYGNVRSWKFQHPEYPVLWSEYQVSIPSTLTFAVIKQGLDSYYINKGWEGRENYSVNKDAQDQNNYLNSQQLVVRANTTNHRWVQKDIRPLNAESYISSPNNYVDKIEFQLSGTYNGEEKFDEISTWKSVSTHFLNRKDFVQALAGDNSWIKDVDGADINDEFQTAKSIYYYVQNNYTCTDDKDIWTYADLYDIYKKQKGTVRELNLLLIAMLKNKGIYAEPVILSTKSNGFVNPYYPVLNKFNYIICRSVINGKVYLLDAANPILGFGQLSTECYNGYARVVNTHRSDSLYLVSDSLTNTEISTLSLSNDSSGNITGSYKYIAGKVSSAEMREKFLTNKPSTYFTDLKNGYPYDVNLTNTGIDSLEQKEMPVAVHYDISFKNNDDIAYFNPIAPINIEKENPFKAAQRFYPVEMPYCTDKTYVLNMQVPAGYTVDELPKSAKISLNNNDGVFQYLIQHVGDNIQLMCRLKLNKATFAPDDYETLRNFFAFVVEKENEQIVFKKQ